MYTKSKLKNVPQWSRIAFVRQFRLMMKKNMPM